MAEAVVRQSVAIHHANFSFLDYMFQVEFAQHGALIPQEKLGLVPAQLSGASLPISSGHRAPAQPWSEGKSLFPRRLLTLSRLAFRKFRTDRFEVVSIRRAQCPLAQLAPPVWQRRRRPIIASSRKPRIIVAAVPVSDTVIWRIYECYCPLLLTARSSSDLRTAAGSRTPAHHAIVK
jgi:hypothetical protein